MCSVLLRIHRLRSGPRSADSPQLWPGYGRAGATVLSAVETPGRQERGQDLGKASRTALLRGEPPTPSSYGSIVFFLKR